MGRNKNNIITGEQVELKPEAETIPSAGREYTALKDFTFAVNNPAGTKPDFIYNSIKKGTKFTEDEIPEGMSLENLRTEKVI